MSDMGSVPQIIGLKAIICLESTQSIVGGNLHVCHHEEHYSNSVDPAMISSATWHISTAAACPLQVVLKAD